MKKKNSVGDDEEFGGFVFFSFFFSNIIHVSIVNLPTGVF